MKIRTTQSCTAYRGSADLWSAVTQASSLRAQGKFSRPDASGACRLKVGDTADQRPALLYLAHAAARDDLPLSPREARAVRGSFPPAFGLATFRAFTLIEVMIACGIFFMATFAILALVSTTLRNARALQRGDVDAGMAAAQIYETLKTNRQAEISGKGNFGNTYPDYSFEYVSQQYQSNGLLQVDIIVNRRGLQKPADSLTIFVYSPDAKIGFGQPNFRR